MSFAKFWRPGRLESRDAPSAIEDCRRAIRWGRLLRQEDATVIQDLIGLGQPSGSAPNSSTRSRRRGDQPLSARRRDRAGRRPLSACARRGS